MESGLTQPELAAMAGVSERTVRNVEKWGEADPSTFNKILAKLGRRITARLAFFDDPVRDRAIELARLEIEAEKAVSR